MFLHNELLEAAQAHAIPEGVSGPWFIRKASFPKGFEHHYKDQHILLPPGAYTSLFRWTDATAHLGGELVMHDFPNELRKHLEFMIRARGKVLITGLGLGCVTRGVLANSKVESVTVIENSPDVMELVAPWMPKDRLKIIQADAVQWTKETTEHFDCCWHDLWTDEAGGEPHLQVVHMDLAVNMAGKTKLQGAWAFPRHLRKLCRKESDFI